MSFVDAVAIMLLDPAVTLPVIAVLSVLLVFSIFDGNRRLRAQRARHGELLEEVLRESYRREAKAIDWTYKALAKVGFDKLAAGEATFRDVFFAGIDDKAGGFDPATHTNPENPTKRPDKGPRPYHTANFDLSGRSPRAG